MKSLSLVSLAVVVSLAAGCKKQPPEVAQSDLPAPVAAAPAQTVQQAVAAMNANFARVHFAYDAATLDAASKAALEDNAKIMANHPRITVEVQGHCDERGTVDYNVALGNKRANAVRDYLTNVGVKATRVTTLSYGEEKPMVAGTGEPSWSQNRRAEFRVLVGEAGVAGSVD